MRMAASKSKIRFSAVALLYWFGILAIFDLITIWFLRSPSVKNPNVAAG